MPDFKIEDRGDPRKYYTQLPNLLDDSGLSVYAYRLYGHLKRVTGEDGKCWQSVNTLSEACKMSAGMITKARRELESNKFIITERVINPHGGKYFVSITLVDVWAKNMTKYATSPGEQPTSHHELASSHSELASSPGEIKNNPLKNNQLRITQKEKKPAKAGEPKKESVNLFPIAKALSEVTGIDFDKNRGRIFKEAKTYKEEDIPKLQSDYGQNGLWYTCDWRGQKGQPPTLSQVRETWKNLRQTIQHKNGNGNLPIVKEDPEERARIDALFAEN